MSSRKLTAVEHTCDYCGFTILTPESDPPPIGLRGTVTLSTATYAGPALVWWVCSDCMGNPTRVGEAIGRAVAARAG